MIVMYLLKIC